MGNKAVKPRYIFANIICLLGIIVNVFTLFDSIRDRKSRYEEYLSNKEAALTEPGMKWYANRRLAQYDLYLYLIIFAACFAAAYVLVLLLHKVFAVFLLVPILDLVLNVMIWRSEYAHYVNSSKVKLLLLLSAVMLVLTILAISFRKILLTIPVLLASAGYSVIGLLFMHDFQCDTYLPGNSFGNMFLFACYQAAFVLAVRAADKAARPAVVAPSGVANAGMTPTGMANAGMTPAASGADAYMPGNAALTSNPVFINNNAFIIDEKAQMFKTVKSFSIYGEDGQLIGSVQEKLRSAGAKFARFFLGKAAASFQKTKYYIKDLNDVTVFSVQRSGMTSFQVLDPEDRLIFSIKGGGIRTASGEPFAKGRSQIIGLFTIYDMNDVELGNATRKFALKSVFSTADKYRISVTPNAPIQARYAVFGMLLAQEMLSGNK